MPASMRSYLSPSSSAAQSAFLTLTELTRPQIFSMSSEPYGLSIPTRIACSQVAAVQLPDQLPAAELVVVVHGDDPVPAALQLTEYRRGELAFFDAHVQALDDAEARAVARRLRILAVVCDAHQHLGMALRLHGAAHDAEAHHRLAVAGEEAGDDRLVRTLGRPDAVRMAGLNDERRAPVLQLEAVHHHALA